MVLILQERCHRLKEILCNHWLRVVSGGNMDLAFKRLQSDWGFLICVTQAYPGMKPYLKGFNLSLETWRGGRNGEGWKLGPKDERGEEQVEEVRGNNKSSRVMEDVKIDF